MLCSAECPCKLRSGHGLNTTGLVTSTRGDERYLDCSKETLSAHKEFRFAPILRTLEKEYNCAGVCTEAKFTIFTDVRKPK